MGDVGGRKSKSRRGFPRPSPAGRPIPVPRNMSELPPDDSLIRRGIFNLAWPAITEMLLMTITQIIDMLMVGRLGAAAIAAVGIANQPSFFIMAVFQALAVGTTAIVARMIGAGDESSAGAVLRQSVLLALVMGVAASILFFAISPAVITFMGAEPEVYTQSLGYFRVVVSGLTFTALTIILIAALRGAGDTRTPMLVRAVANVLNVALNYLLIFGAFGFPRLEVMGAAVGTVASRVVSVALLGWAISRNRTVLSWKGRVLDGLDLAVVRRIVGVGFPAAIEQVIMRSGQLIFVRTVASMGTAAMAAHQIAMNVESLSIMPGFGFSVAATTLVGQHLGAGRPAWAERAGFTTARIAVISMSVMGVLLFAFGPSVVHLYTDDPEVIRLGGTALRILALAQPFCALSFTMAGGLRGAGDTRFVMISTAVGIWVIRLVMAYIFGIVMGWGVPGAWMGMVADQVVRSGLTRLRFARGAWKKLKV
ncbi:MAG: MATE family efflux transporter [Bacillota bacterium]